MDCCRFGRWRGPSAPVSARGQEGGRPAGTPSSFSYLNHHPPAQHHRHDYPYYRQISNSSAEKVQLIPKPYHRRHHSHDMSESLYQATILEDRNKPEKFYRIAISNRDLKWEYLQQYLGLEFEGYKIPKDQTKTLNEKYVLTLPTKLTPKQVQDIDLLRGDDRDAEAFLEDLKSEKKG